MYFWTVTCVEMKHSEDNSPSPEPFSASTPAPACAFGNTVTMATVSHPSPVLV